MALGNQHFGANALRFEGVSWLWQAIEMLMHEAGCGGKGRVLGNQLHLERFFYFLDGGATINDDFIVTDLLDHHRWGIVLVVDLADDFLQDVLDRNQPGGTAVFVNHDSDMHPIAA